MMLETGIIPVRGSTEPMLGSLSVSQSKTSPNQTAMWWEYFKPLSPGNSGPGCLQIPEVWSLSLCCDANIQWFLWPVKWYPSKPDFSVLITLTRISTRAGSQPQVQPPWSPGLYSPLPKFWSSKKGTEAYTSNPTEAGMFLCDLHCCIWKLETRIIIS